MFIKKRIQSTSFKMLLRKGGKNFFHTNSGGMGKEKCINNIVLAGLQYDNNLGDQVIFSVTQYMLKESLSKIGFHDMEIREMDIFGRDALQSNPFREKIAHFSPLLHVLRALYKISKCKSIAEIHEKILCRLIAKASCDTIIDKYTKAIIFSGGGLIKYNVQYIDQYIIPIIKYADNRKIPVMLSAVGIENGYDPKNMHCRGLKKALNRNCVKTISTRDDFYTLRHYYSREEQSVFLVADPACSIQRYYKPHGKRNKNLIGLGLSRGDLFEDYGVPVTATNLVELWAEIYYCLQDQGYNCKIFCNGAKSDFAFINQWMEYMSFSEKQKIQLCYPRPLSSEELIEIICSFNGVISTRLHTSIISYSYDIPSISLVWNQKQKMFGDAIGYPDRFIEYKDFNANKIVNKLKLAIKEGYQMIDKNKYCSTTQACIEQFIERTFNR